MKLRNKKTGEIVDVYKSQVLIHFDGGKKTRQFKSLDELCDEWEDMPEPKEYWFINSCGVVEVRTEEAQLDVADMHKQFGNYFETKEEAEKAVEKLKAWKRLKDKGFEFIDWKGDEIEFVNECPNEVKDIEEFENDLDLLFGGEE